MAPEILNVLPREPTADVFSLGISMYEVCLPLPPPPPPAFFGNNAASSYQNALLAHGSLLPSEGDMWHVLRQGKADPLPGRPPNLRDVIGACMSPSPSDRPPSAHLLALPLVHAAGLQSDPTLLSAKGLPHVPPQLHASHGDTLDRIEVDFPLQESETSVAARHRVCTPTNFAGPQFAWLLASPPELEEAAQAMDEKT